MDVLGYHVEDVFAGGIVVAEMEHDRPAAAVGGRLRDVFNEVVFRCERVEARARIDWDRVAAAHPVYLRHHAGGLAVDAHVELLVRELVALEVFAELSDVAVEVLYAVKMEGLQHRRTIVPYGLEGDVARSPSPHEDVRQPLIGPLVFGVAMRTDEPIEDLARGQRQLRPVLVQHLLDLADHDHRLGLRAPRSETLRALRSVDSVFAASRKQLRERGPAPRLLFGLEHVLQALGLIYLFVFPLRPVDDLPPLEGAHPATMLLIRPCSQGTTTLNETAGGSGSGLVHRLPRRA